MNPVRRVLASCCGAALGLVFPPRCALCDADVAAGDGDGLLCDDCRRGLKLKADSRCDRCAAEPPGASGGASGACPLCRGKALSFDAAVTLGGYQGSLREAVLAMKRPWHEALCRAMGRLLAAERQGQLREQGPDFIVPIPMFWLRRLRRGINSPEVVANCLGRLLGIPVRRRLLVRHRNTLPQAGLSPERRRKNVRGAFRVRSRARLNGARVLLVDDILTTGATCSEVARVLKQAGAAAVIVAVIARTQGVDK